MKKKRYPRDEVLYNLAQENEAFFFLDKLPEVARIVASKDDLWTGEGRPPKKLYDILVCLAIQHYIGFSNRRSIGIIKLFTQARNIKVDIPCFKTLNNYRNNDRIKPYLRKILEVLSKPLARVEEDFSTDSSGERTSTSSSWYDIRTGKKIKKRDHITVHVTSTKMFNMLVAVDSSTTRGRDNIYFREHVRDVCENFHVNDWSGDTIYASRENCNTLEEVNGTPYFKLKDSFTARPKSSPLWKQMILKHREHPEEYDRHYHKRSNSESTFSAKKRKFGSSVRCKLDIAKENESMLKWICYGFTALARAVYALDIEPTFYIAKTIESFIR